MGVFVDDKDLLVHVWEELFHSVSTIIFQKLHQLGLVNDIKEGNFVLVFDFLWNLNYDFILRAGYFVQQA